MLALLGGSESLTACGGARAPASAPATSPATTAKGHARHPLATEWFWEPVEADVHTVGGSPVELPKAEGSVARVEGASRIWDELGPEGRERLLRDGVVVAPRVLAAPANRMGVFYMHLRSERVPYVVTLDSLFFVVHAVFDRVLASVEESQIAPALATLLGTLDEKLTAEERDAGADLAGAYRLAHGMVAVARSLATPSYVAPKPLADVVAQERARVESASPKATSPLLGVPIDYARFAGARAPSARALEWLAAAPLALVAKTEVAGGAVDVVTARTHTRAAMLLARLVDRDVDREAYAIYARIARYLAFVFGPADDVSLTELGDLAESLGVHVEKTADIGNVARIDRVRARLRATRPPAVWDGSGASARAAGAAVRVFGGHASRDVIALQTLTFGKRTTPSTLDVAAWLGIAEARTVLREGSADGYEGFEEALGIVQRAHREEDASTRHASVFASLLDALSEWAGPNERPVATPAIERRRIESSLAGWTLTRHLGNVFARGERSKSVDPKAASTPRVIKVSGAALPAAVEAEPDAIAHLLAAVAQMRRGLTGLGLASGGGAEALALVELEDILRVALRGAEVAADTAEAERRASEGESTLATDLASLPARLADLEAEAGISPPDVSVIVHHDPKSGRALVSSAGGIEPAVLLVRARDVRDGTERALVAVGAHLVHRERVEADRRAFLRGASSASTASRSAYASSFLLAPPSP